MQFHPNELFLLCDPRSKTGKQTKAMALDICSHINEVDVIHEKLSPTYWKEIITMVGIKPMDLINQSHPDFKKIGESSYDMEGWLKILSNSPHLLKAPIAIYRGRAALCEVPSDIMKIGGAESPGERVMAHVKGVGESR